jgi:hypothetical protein
MSEKTAMMQIPNWPTFWRSNAKSRLSSAHSKIRRLAMTCLGTCLISSWTVNAFAQQFTIENARTELVDQVYSLDATLKYQFTPEALTALKNGVSLMLVLDIEVIKPRRYMWDEEIASLEQRYEIQFLALTGQYLLHNKNSGAKHVYPKLEDALNTLGHIKDLPLIDAHLLSKNEHYMVQVRSRLDLDSLPVPLRLKAYFSSEWWLSSGWYSWDLGAGT